MPKALSRPIWTHRTPTASAAVEAIAARVVAYGAGRDVVARPPGDAELIPYDLWVNRAHCRMLARRRIISTRPCAAILRALKKIEREWREGRFTLDPTLEDVHINIERRVAALAGEAVAGVMHTARSRNDQSTADVRLWLRDRLLDRLAALAGLIRALADFAARHARTIAPGWTHTQPAMPSTLGHWAAAHGWALARDAEALQSLWPLINQSPLGAAASYGTSWPIDRAMTARLLGFDAPMPNSIDALSSRGEAEARVGAAMAIMMTHLSSLAADLIFLSSPPRALVRLPDTHVTGSSIMPQKRNPDFCEVTRARALSAQGLAANLIGAGRGLLSGYNRDAQWTKFWIMDLFDEVGPAPEIFADAIAGLTVDKPALRRAATEGFALAADLADHLARTRKIPFRRAYHVIGEAAAIDSAPATASNPQSSIVNRQSSIRRHPAPGTQHPASAWFRASTLNAILKRERIAPPFSEAELRACADPARAVAARRSLGAPTPGDVAKQSRALRASASATRRWGVVRLRALVMAHHRRQ
jgi:argininosuccinate lyase